MLKRSETRHYLSQKLSQEEFYILECCLKRLNLDYQYLFWFMDDIKIHNQMEFIAEDKECTEKEIFMEKERAVILKAEHLLNKSSVAVHEELRMFCHC